METSGTGLNIGIVGGSISGCSAAIVLAAAGHQVTVFERSPHELKGRGAGIGTSQATLDSLIDQNLIDNDFPYFSQHQMPFIGRAAPDDRLGHTAWTMPVGLALLNWGDLYTNLRRRVPDAAYHPGKHVARAHMSSDEQVTIALDDGTEHNFNLLILRRWAIGRRAARCCSLRQH